MLSPLTAYFSFLSFIFSPLGGWWGHIYSMGTDYFELSLIKLVLVFTFVQISYSNSLKVTAEFKIISLIDISLLPRLSQIRLASPKTVTRPIYSLFRCIEFTLLIKWGASFRWSSSLYCPMRNSDQLTIGKPTPL